MTRILAIGSDRHFVARAVARGHDVTVVRNVTAVRNRLATFPDEVEELAVQDQTDLEEVLVRLGHAGRTPGDFDGIHTNHEGSIVVTGAIRAMASLPGPDPATAVLLRDKALQKGTLECAGVRVASSRVFQAPPSSLDVAGMGWPLIVKPSSGTGTARTYRLDDAEMFDSAMEKNFAASTDPLIVEQYVEGDELVLDGWVRDGVLEFASAARYAQTCLDVVSSGTSLRIHRGDEVVPEEDRESLCELASRALSALGLRSSLFHLEAFRSPTGELTFGECAARRGGGLTQEEVQLATGVSLADAAVDLCVGGAPNRTSGPSGTSRVVGSIDLGLRAGLVLGLPNTDELRALPGVEYFRYMTHLGARSEGPGASTASPAASALVRGDGLTEVDHRLDALEMAFTEGVVVIPDQDAGAMRHFQVEGLGRRDLVDVPFEPGTASGLVS